MRYLHIFFIFIALAICSCGKTGNHCVGCGPPLPVAGVVEATIRDTATIQDVFALCDSLGVTISVVAFYNYISAYPYDSLKRFSTYLNTKKYIDSNNFKATVTYTDWKLHVSCFLLNMGQGYQDDWIATMAQLQLSEIPNDSEKYVRVTVPVGQEKAYAAQFSARTGIVKFASQFFLAP